MSATYCVGIDLGTSHTVVAYAASSGTEPIRVLDVERVVDKAQVGRATTLPSVIYAPLPHEALPNADPWLVGDYAHRRGQEVSGRCVVSAKSWLCHAAVDRQAAILPWGAPDDFPKLSPVEASALILEHVRRAWDAQFPNNPLSIQQIILTVPASFDPVARQLTAKAASDAGLNVRLLEEPQGAFYDYLDQVGIDAIEGLLPETGGQGARILVCDVGGGTTDLTLLRIGKLGSELFVERVAVGRHLLLGGDNMDLALAHHAESKLGAEVRFDAQELAQWVLVCRKAKEQLLRHDAPREANVAVAGSGSRLVGHARTVCFNREEVVKMLVDGFFPIVEPGTVPNQKRHGFLGFGLPYEADPSISSHVSAFLSRHLAPNERIDAVQLNGGVFLAPLLASRLLQILERLGHPCRLLPNSQPDLAVARGAVKYGLALNGHGLKIGGGSAHGYYVAFESRDSVLRRSAVCVVPRGSAEAEKHRARSQRFQLRLGVPVRFELHSSDVVEPHAAGTIVELDDTFELLPPIVTRIDAEQSTCTETGVHLEGELTAVGTLELHCVPELGHAVPASYQLAFELRGQERIASKGESARPSKPPRQERLEQAYELIQRVFGKGRSNVDARECKDLFRNLERVLGERGSWTLEVTRSLFDVLAPKYKARQRSADHERLYFMLIGFTLRPGFGDILDRQRVSLVAPLFGEGLMHTDQVRNWQQFLIAWRRLLPGMTEAEQARAYGILYPLVSRARHRTRPSRGFQGIVQPELIDLVGFFERLPSNIRSELGNALIERTWTERDPNLWQSIGRLGARMPLFASAHYVIAHREVEGWLEQLLREPWGSLPTAARAAVNMSRMTGDRARDVSDSVRKEILLRLNRLKAREDWIRSVAEAVPQAANESLQQYGDELPVGLVWCPSELNE